MEIKLIRHGESWANTKVLSPAVVGDHTIGLTPLGWDQARQAGQTIGANYISRALVYCSPYCRARETLAGLLEGAGLTRTEVRVFEDPRLREVEHGYTDVIGQDFLKRTHGQFYYRYHGGESPADCYDRTSGFLDSLMRQAERKGSERALVVTHGLTLRCFVMRFLHLTVEDYEKIANPTNCDIVTLAPKNDLRQPLFTSGSWGVSGLRFREEGKTDNQNGNPG